MGAGQDASLGVKTAGRKVVAAKKIFQLGFDYTWALMGKNKQNSHREAIQIKCGKN